MHGAKRWMAVTEHPRPFGMLELEAVGGVDEWERV